MCSVVIPEHDEQEVLQAPVIYVSSLSGRNTPDDTPTAPEPVEGDYSLARSRSAQIDFQSLRYGHVVFC